MKTKLGITAGLYAAITVLVAYFAGYIGLALLVGYALIREENAWLRKMVVKVLLLTITFSVAYAVINFLPDIVGAIDSLLTTFGVEEFNTYAFNNFFYFLTDVVGIVEKVVFLVLGVTVIAEKEVKIPLIDIIANKFAA